MPRSADSIRTISPTCSRPGTTNTGTNWISPYWTPENRNNKYPAVGAQSYNTQVLGLVSGTFLKIQNITLGYTLPERIARKLRMQSARAYVSVQNPFTFTAYRGSDPEVIGENVYTQLSLYPMTFTFGLNLKF